MTANYVRLELADEKRGMYEYEVRFEPPKDSRDERFKLTGSMKEVFGPTKTSYKLESGPTLETFLAHHRVMLEVWPSFAQAICDMTAPGKRRERAVKPRLSLSETGGLVEELGRWLEVLDEATRELSVIQPQFFLAVTNISQLSVARYRRQRSREFDALLCVEGYNLAIALLLNISIWKNFNRTSLPQIKLVFKLVKIRFAE